MKIPLKDILCYLMFFDLYQHVHRNEETPPLLKIVHMAIRAQRNYENDCGTCNSLGIVISLD